jgi:hypothetical protein
MVNDSLDILGAWIEPLSIEKPAEEIVYSRVALPTATSRNMSDVPEARD